MADRSTDYWKRDLAVYWHALSLQIRGAISLRGAFALQIVGMILNNAAITVAWLFLFQRFGVINGWHAQELIGFEGMNMVVFGIVMIFSVGILDLPRHVDRGSLDSMLTKPTPLLLQLASSNVDPTTFGDLLLGLGLVTWYITISNLSIAKALVFAASLFVGLVIFWCFVVLIPGIIAFYVFDSEQLSRMAGTAVLDSGLYPTGILTGGLRWFLLTIVPGLFIGAVQLNVLHRFDWITVILGVIVASFWLIFSLWLFRRSVRRYESANLVGAR